MTPLKQQFGINNFSIQFTTFLNLFTRKKKRKAILLSITRINMYIYCPCLLQHTVFYKQTFLIPFKINLHISYGMCLVWLETDAHAFVLRHTKYTALMQKTSNIQISCVVLRCHIKAVDFVFLVLVSRFSPTLSPKPKYKSMQIASSVHSPLTKKSVHNGLKTFFSEEFQYGQINRSSELCSFIYGLRRNPLGY